jgi:hypothetical protein
MFFDETQGKMKFFFGVIVKKRVQFYGRVRVFG